MIGRSIIIFVLLSGAAASIGCHKHSTRATTQQLPKDETTARVYENHDAGVHLEFPSSWQTHRSADYVWAISPVSTGEAGAPEISLDVPSVPPHLPGMITLSAVKRGYLDDLRKQMKDLTVFADTDYTLPQSKARWVEASGHDAGRARKVGALLFIHAERVYILRADSSSDQYDKTKAVLDQIIASLRWIN